MNEYLSSTYDKLKSNNFADLTVVMGNESCDLDSAVCALVFASYLHWQHQQIKCRICTRNNRDESTYKDAIFIAILNVNREDFELKTEVAFCFRENNIEKSHLIFRDDLDLKSLSAIYKTNVILVDHHILSQEYQYLQPYLTEIIDHRPIDQTNWKHKPDLRATMEIIGSCATLVTQRVKDLSALVRAREEDYLSTFTESAELLYATIILDTMNFSKEVNRGTPHDEEMVMYLESIIQPINNEVERVCKLERLVAARSDVSSLSAAQLLRKDTKFVEDILIPSFPILVEEFLQKPNVTEALTEVLHRNSCTSVLLLGMSLRGKLRRDAAIFSEDENKSRGLAQFLQNWTNPSLELVARDPVAGVPYCHRFDQLNLSASRKQYIPAVGEFVINYKKL